MASWQDLTPSTPLRRGLLLALTVLALGSPSVAFADYSPPPLYAMAARSELAAVGTVKAVGEKTYTLALEEVWSGPHAAGATVEIERYQNWTCSFRWAPYRVGERLVVFADAIKDPAKARALAPKHTGPLYRTLSAGSEGEMAVIDGSVWVSGYVLGSLKHAKSEVPGGTVYGVKVPLGTVRDAVTRARACVTLEVHTDPKHGWRKVTGAALRCPAPDWAAYRARSPLHERVHEGIGRLLR